MPQRKNFVFHIQSEIEFGPRKRARNSLWTFSNLGRGRSQCFDFYGRVTSILLPERIIEKLMLIVQIRRKTCPLFIYFNEYRQRKPKGNSATFFDYAVCNRPRFFPTQVACFCKYRVKMATFNPHRAIRNMVLNNLAPRLINNRLENPLKGTRTLKTWKSR